MDWQTPIVISFPISSTICPNSVVSGPILTAMATVTTPMHPASINAQQLSVTAPMATMAVVTLTAMDLPTLSMIVPTAANHGEIQSVAQIPMVTVGPILLVQLDGMETATQPTGCKRLTPTVMVAMTTMVLIAVGRMPNQMNSHLTHSSGSMLTEMVGVTIQAHRPVTSVLDLMEPRFMIEVDV